jgi:hypothetical protein
MINGSYRASEMFDFWSEACPKVVNFKFAKKIKKTFIRTLKIHMTCKFYVIWGRTI